MNQPTLYSEDFDFFLKEQIGVVTTDNGKKTTFFSRLDGTSFTKKNSVEKLSEEKEKEICKEIHSDLKYYKD